MPDPTVRVVDVYPYRLTDGAPPEARTDGGASGVEFLVLRRSPGHAYAGTWRMVGGKIDPGETAWAAALRELAEETALEVLRFWALPSVNVFYEWRRDTVALAPAFAAEVRGDVRLDAEHTEAEWLPPEAAAERLAWPEQRRLLRLAASLLASGEIAPELEIEHA